MKSAHWGWRSQALCLTLGLWLLAGLLTAWAAPRASEPGEFHRAATPAETALDRVLRLSEKDPNLVEFLLATPLYKAKADKGYARYFTARLRADLAAMERASVTENCQGKYLEGELCGLDYNPLTCAQDLSDKAYLYRTSSSDDARAVIDYKWPGEKQPAARFVLVREDGQWKVDAVTCRR